MSGPKPEVAGTEIADSVLDLIGNTPLVQAAAAVRVTGPRRDARDEAGDHEPGRLVEGPAGARDDPRRRARRPAAAGRHDRRADIGQHRRRPRHRRRPARLQVRVRDDRQGRAREGRAAARPTAPRSWCARSRSPPEDPQSYYSAAERLVREIPGAFRPNQYANPANPLAHEKTTGPEIWRQTAGRITHFVAGAGTCGTITGIGRYLKAQNPGVQIIAADPEGSVFSGGSGRPYLVEGVGEDFLPDDVGPVGRRRGHRRQRRGGFLMARQVAREEGILIGGSGGTGRRRRASRSPRRPRPTTSSSCSSPTPAAATCRGSSTTSGWPTSASSASATCASPPCSTPGARRCRRSLRQPERHRARGDRAHAASTACRQLPGVQERPAVRRRRGVGCGRRARADGGRRSATRPCSTSPVEKVMGPKLPTIGVGQTLDLGGRDARPGAGAARALRRPPAERAHPHRRPHASSPRGEDLGG